MPFATADDLMFDCDSDEELTQLLADQFAKGFESVVVQHPVEGSRVITREQYEAMIAEDDYTEEELAESRAAFVEKVNAAEIREVWDDEPIGTDINGNTFDIGGLTAVMTVQYPEAIEILANEFGVLIDEEGDRRWIRIILKQKQPN